MREFDYKSRYSKLLTPETVATLAQIHEFRGEQKRLMHLDNAVLNHLVDLAKIQSTESSNKIEGISTSNERLKKLVRDKTMPRNRNEQEIAGYRDVLNTVHENHDYIPLKPSIVLQLHRDLYRYSGTSTGGTYKPADNYISETLADGTEQIRFVPVPAWETPECVEKICQAYNDAVDRDECDPLLVIPVFILDFLCIHPFSDGNGRMSRLLTLLLLYRADYDIGQYISIEEKIAKSKDTYYQALQDSSNGWHEGENDDAPFVNYTLGVLLAACRDFADRAKILESDEGKSKPGRVRELIKNTLGKVTKSEIVKQCPDMSKITIERALAEMVKSGEIIKIGGGRYTAYTWNRERD